jgi:hypothetical protein
LAPAFVAMKDPNRSSESLSANAAPPPRFRNLSLERRS